VRYSAVTGAFQQATAMIDPDAQRRAFEAAVETDGMRARATAAAETCELLREDMGRLRKELSVISSIAAELFSTLVESNPERAQGVSESVLSKHERYRDDPCFCNVRDLLATFSRLP
jgi:hypothetical protein